MRAKWILTLIDLALVYLFFLFIVRAIGGADTIVHFWAAFSVTLAFTIAFAAAWTHFVKVLIDLAHFWGRRVLLFLFLFFFIFIIFVIAARITFAFARSGASSVACTLEMLFTFARPERVESLIVTTVGLSFVAVLGVAALDSHPLGVGVHS